MSAIQRRLRFLGRRFDRGAGTPLSRNREIPVTDAELQARLAAYEVGWPPGHFYSPVPSLHEVATREDRIFVASPPGLPGIDLNVARQLELLEEFSAFSTTMPFTATPAEGMRYYFENENFRYGEAIVLYSMIRMLRPKRIVEVGSGYSSCATLDTSDRFFGGAIQCTFVEPHPELLLSLLHPGDDAQIDIVERLVQDVEMDVFTRLEPNDILFIDSSHVTKVGNDVNYLYLEVLPRLAPGVRVHIHDVPYPFEYPMDWVYGGRGWNEAYLLRAFLSFNSVYEIEFFNSYLAQFHSEAFHSYLPLAAGNPGSSIWLSRRR